MSALPEPTPPRSNPASVNAPSPSVTPEAFLAGVLERLLSDLRVRRTLPTGGVLHLDRRLPFLCVFRHAPRADGAAESDLLDEQLVTGETAYLIAPGGDREHRAIATIVRGLAQALATHFGAFLLVEIWVGAYEPPAPRSARARNPRKPSFRLLVKNPTQPRKTIDSLSKALGKLKVLKAAADVTSCDATEPHPPTFKPLLRQAELKRFGCYALGIEVRPIHRDPATGAVYPAVLRVLRRGLAQALKQAFFTFARNRTNIRPEHYNSFGGRTVAKLVWEVDRQLAEVGDSFDLLLQATPINAEAAWREFRRKKFEHTPRFQYRPLAVEPMLLKRTLYNISIEKLDDPTLAFLFRQKQDELDRKITMLADLGTPRFLPESLQIYGRVSEPLLLLAKQLLERISTIGGDEDARGQVDASRFLERAEEEIAWYRRQYPEFTAGASVREDMFAGLLVSGGHLLIGGKTRVPARRVEALLQHEIGTHLVTYFNGRAQPFRQLDLGLAGYDGLQEGLAVLSEFLVGGLSRARMRLLAARVVAVHALTEGATFVETYRLLDRDYQFTERTAYTIAMRVYRGGGLTKDMVYLQGLVQILDYLRTGGDLEPLLIGKIAADHIALIGELRLRQILKAPPLRPRYLDDPNAQARLAQVRRGMSVLELIEDRNGGG